MRRLWAWVIAIGLVVLLLLPMPIAERFTSPTQDGQYLTNPIRSFQFVLAAARVPTEAQLGRSGQALQEAQRSLKPLSFEVSKVELLFFPRSQTYEYATRGGRILRVEDVGHFVWEAWGVPAGQSGREIQPDVVGLLDYQTGSLLASASLAE